MEGSVRYLWINDVINIGGSFMDRQKFIYVNSYVRSKLSLSYFPLLFFTIFLDKLNRRLKQIYEQIDIFKHMMHTWFFLSIVSKAKKIYTFRWNRIEFIHDAWYRGRASVQGRNMAVSGSRATRIDVTTSFFDAYTAVLFE